MTNSAKCHYKSKSLRLDVHVQPTTQLPDPVRGTSQVAEFGLMSQTRRLLYNCSAISPGALNVEPTDKSSVLRVVIYFSWLHVCGYMCFRCHFVQWGSGASGGHL